MNLLHSNKFYIFLIIILFSCNLEKEIEVDLPEYENQLLVECYLEVGQPYRLALTQSVPYFSDVNLDFIVNNALVVINHRGLRDTLRNFVFTDTLNKKLYNYGSDRIVPANYGEDFTLEIQALGKTISAKTQLIRAVEIDSLVLKFNKDTMASCFTYFQDPPNVKNYYRRMFHKGKSIVLGELQQDFTTNDDLASGETFVFGTGFGNEVGDTLFSTLVHLDKAYFDFLESVRNAQNANGNPFGVPSSIKSNITGGMGIFTGLSYDRDTIIVHQ